MRFDRDKNSQTERVAPERYEPVRPRGCCKKGGNQHARVRIVGHVERHGETVGFIFENSCCGRRAGAV